MKRDFIRSTIAASMAAMVIFNLNCTKADAEWLKDTQDNWTWTENNQNSIGWKNIQDKWYYFNEKGVMQSGWQEINANWYYFGTSGDMKTGWTEVEGKWYYLGTDGVMKTGWAVVGDKWYYLAENGQMKTSWITDSGKWYYLNEGGEMVKGWISDNGAWYFTDEHGTMMTGEITIDGKEYDFGDNGAWVENKDIQTNTISEATESLKVRTGYIIANTTLNVREEASLDGAVLGKLPRGTEVTIVGEAENGFYRLKSDSLEGWSSSEWISFNKSDIPEEPKPVEEQVKETEKELEKEEEESDSNSSEYVSQNFNFSPRTSAPSTNDVHYYSDMNIFYKVRLAPPFYNGNKQIIGNCTWYAWGRAWELTGKQPTDAGIIGNAYQWWGANKASGKFKYGSQPKLGAIAVWSSSMPGSEGCGHVAIVEAIENGKVYISESAWHGVLFKYREIYDTSYLQGYIYLDEPNF